MRIDKWLYYARIYKTRSISTKACLDGDIMINKLKKNNSSFNVSINDVITLIKEDNVKTIRVLNLPNNRVSAKDTDRMYKII